MSLSVERNTAIVGGEADHGGAGAAWIYAASAPETAVSIISFTATPTNITAGQTATLTPVFDNATSATIIDASGNGIGTVVSGAAYIVTPSFTTTYELVVDGTGGERVTRTVTVNVNNGLPQFLQQGLKLVATGAVGNAQQGRSVSISADGNTAIVGGDTNNSGAGAAWVWTRSGGAWIQGPKLVGSGAVVSTFGSGQGRGVALSADGNTAMVGGWNDTGTWVFTRSGNVWTQQGAKLVPSGVPGFGFAGQGSSVSLSADGNTAIIGGPTDDNTNFTGAAWVWTRNAGVWTQQGPKLVGSGAVGPSTLQGFSVSLSADGNTAIVGGWGDNNFAGAAWVWTRSGGAWTQQGPKLVGSGAVGKGARQGSSVSLSADGNTAIIGGPGDGVLPSDNTGAAWVWTRSGGAWTQQGPKLVGPGGVSKATVQGFSVSLSADGNTAIVGGVEGYSQTSCALVWTRSGGVWTHQGTKVVGSGAVGIGDTQQPGVSVSLSANGNTAIIGGWNDNSSAGAAWVFTVSQPANLVVSVSAASYSGAQLAAEAIVAAFGNDLATGTVAASTLPLPTTLNGTTVKIRDSAGTERLAALFFVSPMQINYQTPQGTAAGVATVTVTSSSGALSVGTLQIAVVAPGLFSANASGQGVAAAVALRVKANGAQSYEPIARLDTTINRMVATPIDLGPAGEQVFLILYGTGFRYRSALSAVTAKLGGVDAQVLFAGAQGSLVGLDQVNTLIPRSLVGRGEVDVVLTVDGKVANTVKVSIK